jgi:hypothetical protein
LGQNTTVKTVTAAHWLVEQQFSYFLRLKLLTATNTVVSTLHFVVDTTTTLLRGFALSSRDRLCTLPLPLLIRLLWPIRQILVWLQ